MMGKKQPFATIGYFEPFFRLHVQLHVEYAALINMMNSSPVQFNDLLSYHIHYKNLHLQSWELDAQFVKMFCSCFLHPHKTFLPFFLRFEAKPVKGYLGRKDVLISYTMDYGEFGPLSLLMHVMDHVAVGVSVRPGEL